MRLRRHGARHERLGAAVDEESRELLAYIIEAVAVHTEPLELWTCFACLLGDSAIDKHSTDELRSASHAITQEQARVKARSSCHVEGNPAVIVQTVMSTRGLHTPIG